MKFLRLEAPIFLLLLPLLALFIYAYFKAPVRADRLRFSDLRPFKMLKPSRSLNLRHGLFLLRLTALALIIVALGRPQSGTKSVEIESEGVDIVMALDTSGSMRAEDFESKGERVNRLEVVKDKAKEFIKARKSDRIGLVVFADDAYTLCPLTLDYGILLDFLDRAQIGMAGDSTAIGSAIITSANRLKDLKAKSKLVILLTDGRSNAGRVEPIPASEAASALGIKIYTIGVGTFGKAPVPIEDPLFGRRYIWQELDLDEEGLQKVAQITGGKYFRATDSEGLKNIYRQIDKMEKSRAKVKEYAQYEELFSSLLLPALGLIILEVGLAQTRLRRVP